ncbi:hypothetical protein SAMN05446037_101358 [Anaerovirgula multivorans]|uniref:Uncharacterized protein n=1 Tax=Anaerovirgula multivorans TaxID=312168 RepID=A0A239FM06_9FIRM|nr:hypothetical protein [Anaerovirgula multivorans]SNS57272.1 hypothetical protein SAMN05446037_101358 [Anaerovirgula multivorans]
MLNHIPWYIALFISLPETFLIIKVGLNLFKEDISIKDNLLISLIVAVFSYSIRIYLNVYGLHTIATAVLIVILVNFIMRKALVHSVICVFAGLLIMGVSQSVTVPFLLVLLRRSMTDLNFYPWLNIFLFLPSATIVSGAIILMKKKKIYLLDLKKYIEG